MPPLQLAILLLLEDLFAVCRLGPTHPVPEWAAGGPFASAMRTDEELSVVCRNQLVPVGVRSEKGWRCLRVAGTLDFAAVGVLAALVVQVADAEVSLFAVSTFDTDYLLVREPDLEKAVEVLRWAGHTVLPWQAADLESRPGTEP